MKPSSPLFAPLVALGVFTLTGVATYQIFIPRYRIAMKKKWSMIEVDIKDDGVAPVIDLKFTRVGLECLAEKGMPMTAYGELGGGEISPGNKTSDEFIAACKECGVRTEISVMYERPFIGGYAVRKQTLDWGRCSVAELK
jgi:hypothetical protein